MKKQTIFMLGKSDHQLFETVFEQYSMLVPLVYDLENVGGLTKHLLKDFFFLAYRPTQKLIIYPELTLSHSYRTTFTERLMKSAVIKTYGWRLQNNALYSFCLAIYLGQFTADWLTIYLKKYPERVEEIRLLVAHSSTDIEGLFQESFQAIQPYPKDLLVANSNLVKYITSLIRMENNVFEQGIRQAYQQASLLYEDLSRESISSL